MSALDRVLRPYHYWMPQWYSPGDWVAHEATIQRPETKPRYALPVETHWWMES
jgi:ABC-type oligopeptide transport system substrate-binding subunit